MKKIDKCLVDNPLIFPTADFLSNTFAMMPLDRGQVQRVRTRFPDAIGG